MAKQTQKAEVNNFVKGLITEASPLNFPANASKDEENFELNRDGTRNRRLGLGFEPGATLRTSPVSFSLMDVSNIVTFIWKAVRGLPDDDFLVVQTHKTLSFYDSNAEVISGAGYLGSLEIASFPDATKFSFTSVEGKLVIAAGYEKIAIVTYTGSSFTVEYDVIQVRDVWGVEETGVPSYEIDSSYRGVYDAIHKYNLQNQSWGIPRKSDAGVLSDPTALYNAALGKYPSNSEAVWPGLQFQPVASGVAPYERIFTNLYTEVLGAETSSAKGYYVIDLLKRGVSRVLANAANAVKYPDLIAYSPTLPPDTTGAGAKIVTEFAGRIWYSGFEGSVASGDKRSPDLSNFAVFSQLIRSRQDFTKCYQAGDPTSRESSDIVDTDGGFVRITGATRIVGMVNLETNLIILAENGVWSVTGGSDFGFTATNYKVSKLSSFGCIAPSSIVQEGGRLFFWSKDGIYVVAKDQMGGMTVVNLTDKTIQGVYEDIDPAARENCKGVYDPLSKKIRWLYRAGTPFSSSSVSRELILDTTIQAFTVNRFMSLAANTAEVVGIFASEPFARSHAETSVYSSSDEVISDVDSVVISEGTWSIGVQSTRYLVAKYVNGVSQLTFAYLNNTSFRDWEEIDSVGVDAKAYLVTGAMTGGDSSVEKQLPYLTMHFTRTESGVNPDFSPDNASGCLIRTMWGWSDGAQSNKWSALQQAYRYRRAHYVLGSDDSFNTGFEVVTTKNKIRGRGKAFSIYMETEPYKDCRIIGWSMLITGNSQ